MDERLLHSPQQVKSTAIAAAFFTVVLTWPKNILVTGTGSSLKLTYFPGYPDKSHLTRFLYSSDRHNPNGLLRKIVLASVIQALPGWYCSTGWLTHGGVLVSQPQDASQFVIQGLDHIWFTLERTRATALLAKLLPLGNTE
ncbi:hypothetical protein [uncultured Ruegeria sp.]|uniref:hypothetical protein n=1 Tax=uncultured Ruegeria sp. TaxID=259304 RepID=UPI0026359DC1|nr:hypothetical protein [uncultured Ruegeria sp.]